MSIWKKFTQLFKEEQIESTPTANSEVMEIDKYSGTSSKNKKYLQEMRGWVGSCVTSIAEEVASIKIKLYKYEKNGVEEVFEHPVLDLLYKINNFTTKFDQIFLTQSYLELCGEAPWFLDKKDGIITDIYILQPDRFSLITNNNNLISGYKYNIGNGKTIPLGLDEVIFFKIPNPAQPFRGIGTLQMASMTVDVDNYSEEWNKNFYKNSAHPDTVLKVKVQQMDEQQREMLKKSLRQNYGTLKNAHKTMVLFGDMEFEKLTSTQKDMDFLEQQKFSRDKILGMFRVPKAILSQTDGVNFASAKASQYIYSRFTIKPKMTRFIEQLNEFLLPQFKGTEKMFFDFVSPVPEDEELTIKKYESALKVGSAWMTINEVRKKEGLPDVENGDVIYQNSNILPLGEKQEDTKKYDDKIKAMKARNSKYFEIDKEIEETKYKMIEDIKQGIKKKIKEKDDIVRKLTDKEKLKDWQNKNDIYNKYVKKVKDGQIKIFQQQRKYVIGKLFKLKSIKSTSNDIYNDIKLNNKTETIRTLKIELPILTELYKEAGDEAFKLLESEMTMEITNEVSKLLKSDCRKFAKSATDTTNDAIKVMTSDIIGQGGSMLDLQKGLGSMFEKAEKYRADRIATTETQRYNNNASEQAFKDSGLVESKEWYANPGACQFCQPLHGKTISLGKNYFDKGNNISGNNGGTMDLDYGDTLAPPLHPNCFIDSQIPIYTSKGWKHIGKIKIGDLVLTHKGKFKSVTKLLNKQLYQGNVIKIYYGWENKKGKIRKQFITVTPEHPILTERGWILASDLQKEDKLIFKAKKCKECGKLFPHFSVYENVEFCSSHCANKYTAILQFKDENQHIIRSEGQKQQMIKEDRKNKWSKEKLSNLTKNANIKVRELASKGILPVQLNNTGKNYIEIYGKKRAEKIKKKCSNKIKQSEYHKNGTWNKGLTKYTSDILKKKGEKQIEFYKKYPEKHPNRIMGRATMKGNEGYISKGQRKLYQIIKNKFKDAELEYPVKTNIKMRFPDIGIPSLKIDCEYDGTYWHQDKEKDLQRDIELKKVGWTTLRFNENNFNECLNEISLVMANHNNEYEFMSLPIIETKQWILKKARRLYNFAVDTDESYIAKGLVTHNCRCTILPVFKATKQIKPKTYKPIKKDIIIVKIDNTKKEYENKIKELKQKMVDINKIESKSKKNKEAIEEEKNKLITLRKSIIKDFNNEQNNK